MGQLANIGQGFHAERVFSFAQEVVNGVVETFGMETIDLGGVHAEGAVNKDGRFGQLAVAGELMEGVNNLLGAADGKGGDDDFAFFVERVAHEPADLFVGAVLG